MLKFSLVSVIMGWVAVTTLPMPARAQQQSRKPQTFLIDAAFLESSKEKIRNGDDKLSAAKESLQAAADRALKNGPYSVTLKTRLPPSGDKHDYMSVAPYWWPDPSKPDGLPYIRRDGETNPLRHEVEDADNLKSLSHDVKILALAFYFTGEKKYSDHAAYLIKAWYLDPETKMNPHLNYGQAIPGITDGRGIGIIDTKCMVDIVDAAQLLALSPSWSGTDHKALQNWFNEYLRWMRESALGKDEEDQHNNHGTYYDVQAGVYALFTGQQAQAKQILEQNTMARIDSQIMEDGSQPHELARTKSTGYCSMNLRGFMALAHIAEHVGLDLWNYRSPNGRTIKSAFVWMLPYASGEREWTHKQIVDFDWSTFLPLVRIAARHYPELNVQKTIARLDKNDGEDYLSLLANTVLYK